MKLTAEARRNLPDDMFGLPKDREYPLNDKNHVIQAVKFFKFCPAEKKLELAKNINRRAKELKMQLAVSKDTVFYKYANKNIIKEDSGVIISENFISYRDSDIDMELKNLLNEIDSKSISSEESLYELEVYLKNKYTDIFNLSIKNNKINIFEMINERMYTKYIDFIESLEYITGDFNKSELYNKNILVLHTLKDIFYSLKLYISIGSDGMEYVKEKLDIVLKIMNLVSCNYFIICRFICETMIDVLRAELEYPKKNYDPIKRILNNFLKFPFNKDTKKLTFIDKGDLNTFTKLLDIEYRNVETYLKNTNKDSLGEISSIIRNMSLPMNNIETNIVFNIGDVVNYKNYTILNILTALHNSLLPDNIKVYDKNYSLSLDEKDILFIKKLEGKYHTKIIAQSNRYSETNYFGLDTNRLFLYGKCNSDPYTIIAVMLYNSNYTEYSSYAYTQLLTDKPTKSLKIFKITYNDTQKEQVSLTEGLSLDKDGNVKFTLASKKSFMDRYDECHKQLIVNWNAKNYEGVKSNLAFMFSLILLIERDYIHNKKVNAPDDAIKARSFAINDFKTYTKKIKIVEPDFDFTKYYEESDYDKLVVKISKDTIIGVRKLFQAITMGL